jgi:endonuclease/exonuclease/phosphatase family metal-dependent hydrolase
MKSFLGKLLLVAIVFFCGWLLWNKDKFDSAESVANLAKEHVSSIVGEIDLGRFEDRTEPLSGNAQLASWGQPVNPTIRIASFNIQTFGQKKSSNQLVMDRLAQICSNFDLIAIQEIRSTDQSLLPNFVRLLNRNGARYNFAISPRLGRTSYKEQAAFIFDESKVQLDDSFSYTINDPDDVLHREPYVGWFRTRGPQPDQAFTFTLANLHMDSQRPDLELAYLTELHRIIRKDGRGEDDVILIGDFNSDDRGLETARKRGGLTWVVNNTATNTRNTTQYDNIVFDAKATDEFLFRGGVFDFMKHLNLTLEDALAVSDHMPVWAEFSVYEGGQVRTAQRE